MLILSWQMENSVFENTINDINAVFVEAEKMSCGRYCEGCLGCLTAYLVFFCMETHYEKASRSVLTASGMMDSGGKARRGQHRISIGCHLVHNYQQTLSTASSKYCTVSPHIMSFHYNVVEKEVINI